MMEAELRQFRGLVFKTAHMNAALVKMDPEDLMQVLWIKVWQASVSFQDGRSRLDLHRYVFQCVTNKVKDLRRDASRDVKRREKHGFREHYIEDVAPFPETFEAQHMSTDADVVFASVEDTFTWPSTVTEEERRVIVLLALDYTIADVSREMGMSRTKVKSLHLRVQEKMQDWNPGVASGELIAA